MYGGMYGGMDVCLPSTKKVNLDLKAKSDFNETWYVGSGGYKYYPCKLLTLNAHINELICIFVLIG